MYPPVRCSLWTTENKSVNFALHATESAPLRPCARFDHRSLRLQASEDEIEAERAGYRKIQDSFRCFEVTGQKGTAEQAEEDVKEALLGGGS